MRHRAFPGHGPDVDAKYERAGMWLLATIYENGMARSWCTKNNIPIRKAQGETVDQYGGYLVPQELANAILDLRDRFGAFRRRALIWPMKSDNTVIPRKTGGVTAYIVGENNAVTETTTDSIDALELTTKKIGAIIRMSSELEEDALKDAVDYLANEMAWAFAAKEDDCAFNGDGTSTYGGMRGIGTIVLDGNHTQANVAAASTHKTFLTIDQTDLGNVVAAVRASALPRAAWFISALGFGQTMCRLAGTSNGFIETRMVDGEPTPCWNGFPVIMTQKLPAVTTALNGKVMLAFGDMYAGGVLGQRRGITIARSEDRYLDSDQIAVRGIERVHCNVHDLGDNTNKGSLAALVGTT